MSPETLKKAAQLTINAGGFRWPLYRPEVKMEKRKTLAIIQQRIEDRGFVATPAKVGQSRGFKIATPDGVIPEIADRFGFISMDNAMCVFSK
jgi:hypothetical protein